MLILYALSFYSPDFYLAIFVEEDWTGLLMSGLLSGIMVGIFEELGWSGFAIPRLLKRYSVLSTGLLVGLLWGAWHFILFWEQDSFLAGLPLMILLGRLFAWLPPYRVLMVWIYKGSGSLLVTILSHVSLVFTVTALVPMSLGGMSLLVWLVTWGMVLWVLVLFLKQRGGSFLWLGD
jgi:membrane protease YdiL (CAAX protease family)